MVTPRVTVICLSYEHASYLREAVDSVLAQDYPDIEFWLADDASKDNSASLCRQLAQEHPGIKLHLNGEHQGYTSTFNAILPKISGKYLIDLAADDVLFPQRISRGVEVLESCSLRTGVQFTNALLIDAAGNVTGTHYQVDANGHALETIPQGNVFTEVVGRYFINPATMMFRTSMLDQLGGYDATLSYEDFDIWVRSAREHDYVYTDEILVKKRIHQQNYSATQYRFGSPQIRDTYHVCVKVSQMNINAEERTALRRRIGYEMRQCLRTANLRLFYRYAGLLSRL